MTDQRTEHDLIVEGALSEWLGQERPLPADRDAQLHTVLGRIHEAPGTRRRFLRWLQRDSLARRRRGMREPHVETKPGRNRLMYSATGLVAIFAILALIVNVSPTNDQTPAAGGATLRVAADGSGDHASIGEALLAAHDGDTILVAPGTYQEALLIGKDITIAGDGAREDVVITGYDDPAMWPTDGDRGCEAHHPGCSVLIVESSPTLADLTFSGAFAGVWAVGGSPVLERVTFDRVGKDWSASGPPSGTSLVASDETDLVLRDSLIVGGRYPWLGDGANALIEDNTLRGGAGLNVGDVGPKSVIRGNHIGGSGEIFVWGETTLLIEDNVIDGAGQYAIDVGDKLSAGPAEGVDPIVRNNVLTDSGKAGIYVKSGSNPTVEGNRITGSPTGIQVGESEAAITGNEISDGTTGIVVVSRGTPTIMENTIDVSGRGIVAGANTSPTIEGNDVCGGEISIYVAAAATPEIGQNQTCEGGVAG